MEKAALIRQYRRSKGLSQTELAEKANVNLQYLNKIENGKATNVSEDFMWKIAQALEIDVAVLNNNKERSDGDMLRIGFSPTIWSAPLLTMYQSGNHTTARLTYAKHTSELDESFYFHEADDNEPFILPYNDESDTNQLETPEDKQAVWLSEEMLVNEISKSDGELDLIFLPSVDSADATDLVPIATVCDTSKGGLYAVVFAGRPSIESWQFEKSNAYTGYDLYRHIEQARKKAKKHFLDEYRTNWEAFLQNSVLFYQESALMESVFDKLFATYKIHGRQIQKFRLADVDKTVEELNNILISNLTLFEGAKPTESINVANYWKQSLQKNPLELLTKASNALFLPAMSFLEHLSFKSKKLTSNKSINAENKSYTVFLGWEPYITAIRKAYEEHPDNKGSFCIIFNAARFLNDNESLQLKYDCLVRRDRLEELRNSTTLLTFFRELNSSLKFINKQASSAVISQEIELIAAKLGMPPEKAQRLIQKINFSLKFYSNYVLE